MKVTSTTEIYTLSLHDALPIYAGQRKRITELNDQIATLEKKISADNPKLESEFGDWEKATQVPGLWQAVDLKRSEEHTSELQSQSNLVCRLLLEKKNKSNRTMS